MTVTIGSTDITKYIKFGGITFSRNDVEAPDAGRDLSGLMHRGRVAIKERMDIETIPMNKTEVAALHLLLQPETFTVTVNPYPNTNASKQMTMYSNSIKTTHIISRTSDDLYTLSFPLVEV